MGALLAKRFRALDTDQDGYLIVGIDVANKEQVRKEHLQDPPPLPCPHVFLQRDLFPRFCVVVTRAHLGNSSCEQKAAEIQKISASTGRPLPEIWLDPQYQDTFLKLVPPEILELVVEEEAETTEEDPASEADLAQIGGSTINGGEDKAEV